MRTPQTLSVRTNHPTSDWRLFPDVVVYAERKLRQIAGGADLLNAWTLFVFLVKKHGHPDALNTPGYWFPVCRRGLSTTVKIDENWSEEEKSKADRKNGTVLELGMSANRIQRGIPFLKEAGLMAPIERQDGARHRRVGDGVRALAVQYGFSSDLRRLLLVCQPRKGKQSKDKIDIKNSEKERREAPLVDCFRKRAAAAIPVYTRIIRPKGKHSVQQRQLGLEPTVRRGRRIPVADFMRQLHQDMAREAQGRAPTSPGTSGDQRQVNGGLEAVLSRFQARLTDKNRHPC